MSPDCRHMKDSEKTHQPLRIRLAQALQTGSRSERTIANFMSTALADLPFETAGSLAEKVGVSEATVGRFCRMIGYANFRDFKDHLKDEIGDQPWLISDRLTELRDQASRGDRTGSRGLELEISGLVAVYELAQSPEWRNVVERLAHKPRVFVAGFQTERGIAQYFANQLLYVRDGVQLLDLSAGNFAELFLTNNNTCLVVFEARRYARQAQELAQNARDAGIPVTLITDQFCSWGREASDEMFAVATQFNQFWDSTALMASLGNLLINDIFLELGPGVEDRLVKIAGLYGDFTGHVRDPVGSKAK